jgi:hypothetical protein
MAQKGESKSGITGGNSAYAPKRTVMAPNAGNGGGNSGAVISPAPKLGWSAYQDPRVPVKAPLPRRQGV